MTPRPTGAPAGDLALILEAAQAAGRLALKMREGGLSIRLKTGDSPVTDADLAADALLTKRLRDARPDYGWLSEETADDLVRLQARRLFLVDPIDGTSAFARAEPWWSVAVAVVEDGVPVCGVVYAAELGETYAASLGEGATLNGSPIRASGVCDLAGCSIVGDPRMFQRREWPEPWPDVDIEWRSSTAYRMCLVASGATDAALAFTAKHEWDLAAADLIAREAGAFVGDHLGRPFSYNRPQPVQPSLVCTAPALAPLILDRVRHIAL
jgi:myo-inositol-1(or 4)-monophosphatase